MNYKWDFNKCEEEALKCNSRSEFKRNNSSAYTSARKNKWLDDICSHMVKKEFKKNIKWTFDKCKEEALKYNSRSEFQKKSSSSYLTSLRKKWLNDICSHMKPLGHRYKRCIYSYEFTDKSVYIGLTYNLKTRHNKRINSKKDTVMEYKKLTNLEYTIKQLTEYINVDIAIEMEGVYLNLYKNQNWNILNKCKTGSIGGTHIKWDYDNCKNESSKYKTLTELKKNNISAYRSMKKNGWVDDIYPLI